MAYLWEQLRGAVPLISHGNPYIVGLALGHDPGRGHLDRRSRWSSGCRSGSRSASAASAAAARCRSSPTRASRCPPVIVGVVVLLLLLPQGAFGSLRIEFTLTAVYIAQTMLALPYIVALTPAAIQGLPPGLLDQARALGAGRGPALAAGAARGEDRRARGGDRRRSARRSPRSAR